MKKVKEDKMKVISSEREEWRNEINIPTNKLINTGLRYDGGGEGLIPVIFWRNGRDQYQGRAQENLSSWEAVGMSYRLR